MKFRLSTVMPALALLSTLTTSVMAAPAGARPGMSQSGNGADRFLDMMAQKLSLTPSQKTKFAEQIRISSQRNRAIFANKSLSDPQKMAKLKAINDQSEKAVNAMLSPAQRAKLAAFVKQMQRPMGSRPGGFKMRPEDDLHITPAQKQKLNALDKEVGPKFSAVFNSKSLSQEQKKAKMKILSDAASQRMLAILTPEQRRKRANTIKRMRAEAGAMGGQRPMR